MATAASYRGGQLWIFPLGKGTLVPLPTGKPLQSGVGLLRPALASMPPAVTALDWAISLFKTCRIESGEQEHCGKKNTPTQTKGCDS